MADEPNVKPPIPSQGSAQGAVAAVDSSHAPILFFDAAPSFGCVSGIVRVTLVAQRLIPTDGQYPHSDVVIVGHLRMGVEAALSLKNALEGALLLASPPAERPN
jgi:hypothetical protein